MTRFITDLTTRGYEADASRRVPLPMFFHYLEHQRWRALCDPEVGLADHVDRGHFFVVQKQRMELFAGVGQDVPLRVYMWADRIGRSTIDVVHEVRRRTDGRTVARAQVVGLWLGPNRRLTRIPDGLRQYIGDLEPPPEVEPDLVEQPCVPADADRLESSYIRPPEVPYPASDLETLNVPNEEDAPADAHRSLRTVRWSELDIFDHVNAATYLRFCDDARAAYDLEHDSPAGTLRRPQIGAALHYDRETREGETLEILSWRVAPGRLGFVLRSAEDGSLRSRVLMALAPVTEAAP